MCKNLWILGLPLVSLVGLMITSPIARGESEKMNLDDCNVQQTKSPAQPITINQTPREVLDYWTKERMQSAKPLMPTVAEPPNSGESSTRELMPKQPLTPTVPNCPSSGTQSDGVNGLD